MGNIGIFTVKTPGWKKLEDVIKETKPDFSFVSGTTYMFQPNHACRICIQEDVPTDKKAGFELASKEKVAYTHTAGVYLYVDSVYGQLKINIAQ